MTEEENKKLLIRLFSEGINKKNTEVLDEIISPTYVNHGFPDTNPGIAGFREIVENFTSTFPDINIDFDTIIAEGDMVATMGSWKGTHQGNFMGVSATGKEVHVTFMDMWKFKEGKAIENWVFMDIPGLMQQLH